MYQKMCDKCGTIIPNAPAESQWVGPEVMIRELISNPFDLRDIHLCKDCTERFLDWLRSDPKNN